jgi:two-component system nitrogen regulation response regulator NtrX
MPLGMQAKLLRVLEEREIERIGGEKPVAVDVRVIVATHRNLEELVRDGQFRQDLFHRVYVFPIALPPLRERRDDIAALVEHFRAQLSAANAWKPLPFSPEAIEALKNYAWPGNVRELRNVVERLLLLANDQGVSGEEAAAVLPAQARGAAGGAVSLGSGPLHERVAQFEREVILAELRRNHFNVTSTAKALGLERSHLYKKAEQLGVDLSAERQKG